MKYSNNFSTRVLLALVLIVAPLSACKDSTDPDSASSDLTVESSRSSLSIVGGAPVTAEITISRLRGYADTVTLEVQDLPPGLTASFTPEALTENASTAQLTITVSGQVDPGTALIVVRASGKGAEPASANLTLTIVDPASSGFTLTGTPNVVTIPRGGTGTVTIDLQRNGGFSEAVALTALGLPINVTPSFAPALATGNTVTLTLNVGSTVSSSAYLFTVNGDANGVASQAITLTLLVSPGTAGVQRR